MIKKKNLLGSGERAQQLTELTALEEDLGLIPNTYLEDLISPCNSSPWVLMPSSGFLAHLCGYSAHTDKQVVYTHAQCT